MAASDDMSWLSSPLVWRRWLGSELVRLRTAVGLTQRDAAAALQCSVGKVSYIESGDRSVSARELEEVLLELYDVPIDDWDRYVQAAETASRQGWWDAWSDEDLPRDERRYIGLEDGAIRLRAYQPSVIHGLLQVPAYTTANLRVFRTFSEERIVRLVELRSVRQRVLTRPHRPLHAHLVMDEAAVRRQIGGPEILSSQLAHIVRAASEVPHLVVQVIPFSVGAHGANFGPYSILEFPWEGDAGLVYMEGFVGATYLESLADVYRHSVSFDRLTELALGPEQTIELLKSIARAGELG